jgi:3',5'-cyclic AMP phosphodiesterase CpdA
MTQSLPLFRFGIVADPQYAAREPHAGMDRYYENSPAKLAAAIQVFNAEDLSFVMTLGDIIDRDFAVAPEHLEDVAGRLGMPAPYYSLAMQGWRFIALNGNEVSTFAPPEGHPYREIAAERLAELQEESAINAHAWNAMMSDSQFSWLEAEIADAAKAGERVIVMNHYPVYPPNEHDCWDRERIIDLLSANPNVAAYFNGHNHVGNYGMVGGCHCVNFKGMVDTESENTFAIVDIHTDHIEIRGFGREESRVLPI